MNSTISSPSNKYDLVEAANQPIINTFSVTMTLIIITSILNVSVLSRRALRSSSCTYYFLASVPPVLVNVVVAPLNAILINSYGFYFDNTSITCKLVMFLLYTTSLLYSSMLACATIDRFLSSSTSVRMRRFSQVRVARRIIIIVWIVALIYMSPFMVIYEYDPNSNSSSKCVQRSTTLINIYLMTRVVLYYVMIPAILAIFGTLTIYNIRSQKNRVVPVNQVISHRRTEGQLARMLIIQVAVYLVFFTPSGIIYFLVTFIPSMNTTYYATIRTLARIWQQGGYFISFFFYILSGKIYREELKKMVKWHQIRDKISQCHVHRTPINLPIYTTRNIRV